MAVLGSLSDSEKSVYKI